VAGGCGVGCPAAGCSVADAPSAVPAGAAPAPGATWSAGGTAPRLQPSRSGSVGSGPPYQSSISARAIDVPGGSTTEPCSTSARSVSRSNQRAARSSSPSTVMSVDSARARKPSMREAGNGHGWLPRYSTSPTTTEVSSRASRRMACSTDSPGSTNPASVENRCVGHAEELASSSRSASSTTAMITAASVRG
jgi:hypothetical protein